MSNGVKSGKYGGWLMILFKIQHDQISDKRRYCLCLQKVIYMSCRRTILKCKESSINENKNKRIYRKINRKTYKTVEFISIPLNSTKNFLSVLNCPSPEYIRLWRYVPSLCQYKIYYKLYSIERPFQKIRKLLKMQTNRTKKLYIYQ